MKILLLFFISAVLAIVFIYFIPLRISLKEKNLVTVSTLLIGTFGVILSFIAAAWQAELIMLLLAVTAGYIIVSRSAGKNSAQVTDQLGENAGMDLNPEINGADQQGTFQKGTMIIPPERKVFPDKQEIELEEDISFLEERNKIHIDKLPLTNFDEIPVINFDIKDNLNEEDWINEVENQEMYAVSQS
jgi:hypothetical protein